MNEGRIEAHKLIWNQHSGETYLLPSLTHRGFVFPPELNRRCLSGPFPSACKHPNKQSLLEGVDACIDQPSCDAFVQTEPFVGFIKVQVLQKGGGPWATHEIKRGRRREGNGGVVQSFSQWHWNGSYELQVLNWNVTMSVGVVSHSLQGLILTFMLTLKYFKMATKGRTTQLYR